MNLFQSVKKKSDKLVVTVIVFVMSVYVGMQVLNQFETEETRRMKTKILAFSIFTGLIVMLVLILLGVIRL